MKDVTPAQAIAAILHRHRHVIPLLTGMDWWHTKPEHKLTPDQKFITLIARPDGCDILIDQETGAAKHYRVTVEEIP